MTSIISLQAEYQPENILVAIVVSITVLKLTKRIENVLGEGG